MPTFKAGLIGCGNIGGRYDEKEGRTNNTYTHAGMYRNTAGLELVCAADTAKDRLQEFGQYWGVSNLYEDPVDMFRQEQLDIISIATPDETHAQTIMSAVEVNPPRLIFSEKPLAEDLDSAVKVINACREKNVTLIIDYIRRWDSNHREIKEFISNNGLGPIQSVVGYYVRGIRHNGCQMINLLQFLFGPIKELSVSGAVDKGSFNDDPSLNLNLKTENGHEVHMIALDQQGYGFSMFELDIFGMNGRIRIVDGGQKVEFYGSEQSGQFQNFKLLVQDKLKWNESTYGSAMLRAGEEIYKFLKDDSQDLHGTPDEALSDLMVIEAALSSARAGNKTIEIKRNLN